MSVKNAIIKAKVSGVLTELMVRTNTENVVMTVDGVEVTLASKLAELLADVALKANATDVTQQISDAINGLIDGAPGTYDTLKEIADYISEHGEVVEGLNAAIGSKASQTDFNALQTAFNELKSTVDGLGALAKKSVVSESDLDAALAEKVNAAAEGNHSHANKTVLDGITEQKVVDWDDAVSKEHTHDNKTELDKFETGDKEKLDQAATDIGTVKSDYLKGSDKTELNQAISTAQQAAEKKATDLNTAMDTRMQEVEGAKHTHANKTTLDGITDAKVVEWDSKGTVFAQATEPADLAEGDLFLQIVD